MSWVSVCKVNAISDESPVAIKVGEKEIGIFMVEGQLHAIEDICPHAYALLTEGFIEGRTIECPLHEAIFDIPTGKLQSGPGCRDLTTYEVRIEGDDVLLHLA
ncbi:non-heme iron oxygenase ferredoxin subunit [Aeromonas cavernicola]|uniref:Rieske (2Fe-2S) protein n=1 Tax=Aeromonas cavernicola TaxID=1006623 RepID=A0A2H9U9E3_9GAMM|nr:non-heme iron oxygenase ferredoxin subunit [Aeromonas cavernicola]PJG60644.1 Rieske (2Fe-2S) protein [Aeromonas cavernicola]